MAKFTSPPWLTGGNDEFIVIGSADGFPICAIPRQNAAVTQEELEANAEVIALAPEFLLVLANLVDVMRRSDPDHVQRAGVEQTTDDEWDFALDEAEALLEAVREAGITVEAEG